MRDAEPCKLLERKHFRRAAHSLDSWTLVIALVNNLLHLFMRWRKAGSSPAATQMTCLSVLVAAFTLLQLGLHRARPDTYYKHRYYILLAARLLRTCTMAEWALQTRWWSASPSAHTAMDSYYFPAAASADAFRPLSAALALLAFSGTLHSLAHALTVPLPFATQAAFHAPYLALMLAHARAAARALERTPHRRVLEDACAAINGAVVQAVGQDPRLLRRLRALPHACRHHSALVLVVFTQLYLGTVLPLLHSRRIERGLREATQGQGAAAEASAHAAWQAQEQGQPDRGAQDRGAQGRRQEPAAAAGWAVPGGPALAVGAAAGCWLLAVLLCSASVAATGEGAALEYA